MAKAVETNNPTIWQQVRKVTPELYALDSIPLVGELPPFPWEKLAKAVEQTFGLESFTLIPSEVRWHEKEEVAAGIPTPHHIATLTVSGIDGTVSFILASQDLKLLMAKALHIDPSELTKVPEEYLAGFFQFFIAKILSIINGFGYDNLSISLASSESLANEPMLGQDIFLKIQDLHLLSRLLLPKEFQKSWEAFTETQITPAIEQQKLARCDVIMLAEAGRTEMPLEEWMRVQPGDFLLLESAFFDPTSKQSECLFTVNGEPIFRAKKDGNQLTISEILTYHEAATTMVEKFKEQDLEGDEEFEEDIFDEEDDEELEMQVAGSEEEPEVRATSKTPPLPTKLAGAGKKIKASTATSATSGKPISLRDVPVTVTVELARLIITADKLMELQPGNMLELQTSGTTALLSIQNKIVGKGEIIKIGDTLGVRILEMNGS